MLVFVMIFSTSVIAYASDKTAPYGNIELEDAYSRIVTYANEAKMKYANVSKDTLKQYGAVSENTAREMAEGVAKANNADVAAGISGIAGPTGGTEDKPVGMVCFGFYIDGKVFSDTKHFGNIGRNNVRDESVEYVLDVLIKELS